jgi:hypothetical protein
MANYKLKIGQEQFAVVDGPFEGRKYLVGEVYQEIPPAESQRFDEIIADVPAVKKTKGVEA